MDSEHQDGTGRKLAVFRKALGKSQAQFAVMLGVSKHTIISVENGRNRLSPKLAQRIRIATGCPLSGHESDASVLDWWTKEERFTDWRQRFKSDEETAQLRLEELEYWLGLVFRAAGRPGVAGNRDRLPAVYLSLIEWLRETREAFKLERDIDDILEEDTRHLKSCSWTEHQLREDRENAQWVADQLGISLAQLWREFKKHRHGSDWVILHAELEARHSWDPEAGQYPPAPAECRVKKLRSKYWFETIPCPQETPSG